jgi:nucleoside diphosphate kinase
VAANNLKPTAVARKSVGTIMLRNHFKRGLFRHKPEMITDGLS